MTTKPENPAPSEKGDRVRELADRVTKLERSLMQYVIDVELDAQRKHEAKMVLAAMLFGLALGLWLGRRMIEET
ncbi:MAG TPA: hypothetical protein VKP61_15050 [Candidatus Acidoferrum sp.]|nr:hypothetical protein [Candidatus Acidoferrum sp.]